MSKKESRGFESPRNFRIQHQVLHIKAINFEKKCLMGFTDLLLKPLTTDAKKVKLNCKQCCVYSCSVLAIDAHFLYHDPLLDIDQGDCKSYSLDYLASCHSNAVASVDPDCGNGELIVRIPEQFQPHIAELRPIKLHIEFSLDRPACGVQFVLPPGEGSPAERGAHIFTYGHENSARLWFPCVDSYSEPCTWRIEVTVPREMVAVSVGELKGTHYTADTPHLATYTFRLTTPIAPPNIALAVGPFDVLVDPNLPEVTHFCLPHLMPILKSTTAFLHEAFEYYEELLSTRYPFSGYKQVFVDEAFCEAQPYASLTIFSTDLLHPANVIDQTPKSRSIMAKALAAQFFGCFMHMQSWCGAWLTKGIAGYLANCWRRKTFGNNEIRWEMAQHLRDMCEYEKEVGGIVLDPSVPPPAHRSFPVYFPRKLSHTVSPVYLSVYEKKAVYVVKMLEDLLGQQMFIQVLNKLLSVAVIAVKENSLTTPSCQLHNMLLSTASFLRMVTTVSGKDIHAFIEEWVHCGGVVRLQATFNFNRKRNVVELEIRQDLHTKGGYKYIGPLTVTLQELDGSFKHSFKLEELRQKFDMTCHSKSRRQKKKKIPLMTGEEVDMDLSNTDPDSPVLWLRLDTDMTLIRDVDVQQPDYMWQYMLKHERDVLAQREALLALVQYPSPLTRTSVMTAIENSQFFFRVRELAALSLTKVANAMTGTWSGPPAMLESFKKLFGSYSCPAVPRPNNFSNFQLYHMQKALPLAMAGLRNQHGQCPKEVPEFLLDLLKYNDNSKNKWSDHYYRAALIDALAASVTPAVTMITPLTSGAKSREFLSNELKLLLEEITRCLNMEKLLPSYRLVVTCSCLRTLRTLQTNGHLPNNSNIFRSYSAVDVFRDVRVAAFGVLVQFVRADWTGSELNSFIDMVDTEHDPYVRYQVLVMLSKDPPFGKRETNSMNNEYFVDQMWKLMSCRTSGDTRLRGAAVDLYHTLYGKGRPACLPQAEPGLGRSGGKSYREDEEPYDEYAFSEGSGEETGAGGVVMRRASSPQLPPEMMVLPLTPPPPRPQEPPGGPDEIQVMSADALAQAVAAEHQSDSSAAGKRRGKKQKKKRRTKQRKLEERIQLSRAIVDTSDDSDSPVSHTLEFL